MFKIKEIRPLFTGIVTTMHRYSEDTKTESGLLLVNKQAGMVNPYQQVIAVGAMVKDVKPGDIVYLNFNRYMQVKHIPGRIEDNIQHDNMEAVYDFPTIEMDGTTYMRLQANDIEFVVTDYVVDDGGLFE